MIILFPILDLWTLVLLNAPDNWLLGKHLDMYIHLLKEKAAPNHFIFQLDFWQMLTAENGKEKHLYIHKMIHRIDLTKYEWVYVPMNTNNNHWVLIVIGKIIKK